MDDVHNHQIKEYFDFIEGNQPFGIDDLTEGSSHRGQRMSDERHVRGSEQAQHHACHQICGQERDESRGLHDRYRHALGQARIPENNDVESTRMGSRQAHDSERRYHPRGCMSEHQESQMNDVQHVRGSELAQCLTDHRIYDQERDEFHDLHGDKTHAHAQVYECSDDKRSHQILGERDG